MENAIKKWGTGALVAPVLSLTILCTGSDTAFAENRTSISKIFFNNKAKQSSSDQIAATLQPRLTQLEQAVRDLTVQVETLQFSVLQLQNRLDVLEGKAPSQTFVKEPSPKQVARPNAEEQESDAVDLQKTVEPEITSTIATQIFGSIRFDAQGNVLQETIADTDDPQQLYKMGYQYILVGDYPAAEQIFRDFQTRFADDPQIADASFWLGEALYAQGKYREAAQIYIDVQRQHQDSLHGPENLLKLGLSMAQLQETDVACKTLAEVPKRYQQAEPAVLKRVDDEKSRLGCS